MEKPPAGIAGAGVARGNHKIGAAFDFGEHARQQPFIVLQIAVDDGDHLACGRQHAFDHGAGKTAPANAADGAHAAVMFASLPHQMRGSIGTIVVDEDDLPSDTGKRGIEGCDHRVDVLGLAVCRDDDASGGERRRECRYRVRGAPIRASS